MSKRILIQFDKVRIKEDNSMNVEVERLERVFNPQVKKEVDVWRSKGYASTIFKALKMIQHKELLVNQDEINDMKSYMKQIQASNEQLLSAIDEIKLLNQEEE